jgi:PhzF family phenazine biosynthesis protein
LLRWFTPAVEVKLCGHATLASAFVLWHTGLLQHDQDARFHTLSGWLTCRHEGDWIAMDFPAHRPEPCPPPRRLGDALGCEFVATARSDMDFLVEVKDEATLRALRPNMPALRKLPARGIMVTSRTESPGCDFVSRFFAPAVGVDEDPVTGSAHCTLGPWWKAKLGKSELTAFQASERGGIVKLSVAGDRVILRGQAVMMSRLEMLH